MPTTFGDISPEELAARREIVTDVERFRREYENSVVIPPNVLGHIADAAHYGNISPRTAGYAAGEMMRQAADSLRFQRFGEERDMPEAIKIYLGICCRHECLRDKMMFIKERHPEAVVDVGRGYVTVGNYRFILLVNPENDHSRLMGLELTGYRVCPHYDLSEELRARLETRIRQPNTIRFRRYPSLTPLHNIVP